MDGWMDGWMHGWTNTYVLLHITFILQSPYILERGVSRRRVRKREYSSSPERMR